MSSEKEKNSPNDIRNLIKTEYQKCLVDPIYFIKKYVKIKTEDMGIVPFDMFEFQEKALKDIHEKDRTIILKSRQMGISTLVASYVLWVMIFHEGKNTLIISIKESTAFEIISKIKIANDKLPSWMKLQTLEDNKHSIKFKNLSMVLATSSASDSTRSFSASLIIFDECLSFPTPIYIRNKKTGEIKSVKIGELYENNEYR